LGGATKQFEAAMVLCGRGEGLVSIKFQGEKGATNSIIIRSMKRYIFIVLHQLVFLDWIGHKNIN
jgi:hypothetical protein